MLMRPHEVQPQPLIIGQILAIINASDWEKNLMEKASYDMEFSREDATLFYFTLFCFLMYLFKSDVIIFPPHHVCFKETKSSCVQ